MSSRLRTVLVVLVVLVAGTAILAGSGGTPNATLTVSADFSDVNDLAVGAPVQLSEITIGNVRSIALAGTQAKVTMAIRRSAGVPAQVTAQLRQTTILGEHYIDLVPERGATGRLLPDGAVLSNTEVVPGIQQLVQSGSEVFGAVNAAQLATVIDNGAQGFGGQGARLHQLLDDLDTVVQGYASRSGEITSLVGQLDQFSSALAPDASANALAVTNLAQTTQVLSAQSDRFATLLQALDDLATQGHGILSTGLTQTEDQIRALAAVAAQLAGHQQDLATILEALPAHNASTAGATVNDYIQVLEDVIVCGLPGGGSADTATATCNPKATP